MYAYQVKVQTLCLREGGTLIQFIYLCQVNYTQIPTGRGHVVKVIIRVDADPDQITRLCFITVSVVKVHRF